MSRELWNRTYLTYKRTKLCISYYLPDILITKYQSSSSWDIQLWSSWIFNELISIISHNITGTAGLELIVKNIIV
jgi:hypothetical protein